MFYVLLTVLGRSIAIHVSNAAPIMACSNIEPAVLSNTALRLSFPDLPASVDPKYVLLMTNNNKMNVL